MGRDGSSSRRNVLEAAGRIVADRGLEGIRIREIAAEAELSPGAVLYHFPDHSELLYAVHVDTVRRYVEGRVGAASGPVDPIERLLAVLRAGLPPWANEHVIRLLYEMHGLARRSPRHADLLTELWQDEQTLYADIIADGVAQGVFAVDATVADAATVVAAVGGRRPVLFYPNSGETWDAASRNWTGRPGVRGKAQVWAAAGIRGIGGCCRVTPDQIAAIRTQLGDPTGRG